MSAPVIANALEQQRQYHEEVERTLQAAAEARNVSLPAQRQRVNADHLVRDMMETMRDRAQRLQALYEDSSREEELESMSTDAFGTFYARLKGIRDHHRRVPNEIARPMEIRLPDEFQPKEEDKSKAKGTKSRPRRQFQMPEDDDFQGGEEDENDEPANPLPDFVEFSGEENNGRFLDLHAQHEVFVNLKGAKHVEYMDYVQTFHELAKFPRENKTTAQYLHYIEGLLAYLCDFHRRVFPLVDLDKRLGEALKQFEEQWSASTFPGWEGVKPAESHEPIDLSKFHSAAELEQLGMEALKGGLLALGLKCGGTLQQRAARLISVKAKSPEQFDKNIVAKKSAKAMTAGDAGKSVALVEAKVTAVSDMLIEIREATKENVERKQARAAGEADDDDELVELVEEEEEVEDEPKVKRTNMVLDWDGKPIPYWLYRLHGLNHTFTCEICGDHIYRGPKAFTEHFTEWRHAHGMRRLGIPNTKHFTNITKIDDAEALWKKLQNTKESERFQADDEEEFEDSMGNVVNKKTYEDLKRQGLL